MAQKMKRSIGQYWLSALKVAAILAVSGFFLMGGCRGRDTAPDQTNPTLNDTGENTIEYDAGEASPDNGDESLSIQLGEGQVQEKEAESVPQAAGEPLTESEVAQILARLPSLLVEPHDQVDFKLPEDPYPPPRTGETIQDAFPPPQVAFTAGDIAVGPLEVLRYAPEGEIPLAPFVNITFNQPMVPLTTINDLAAEDVPVRLEPDLPGTWRWVGTKTLTFQYDSTEIDRLPMATEYDVTIPAGTESANGGVLAETVRWSFSTPPPKMTAKYPYDIPQPLHPLFFAAFDQRINPASVLATIQVTANSQTVSLKLADDEEVEADEAISRMAEHAVEGRWLAFRAAEPLPADAPINVTIGPGTPSAEGPLVTEQAEYFSFHTYAPLRIDDHGCSWSEAVCPPLTPLFIEFNNPIDIDVYEESMLQIEPALLGATVDIFGDRIMIRGATEGQTTYYVTVDGSIQDIFGQTLGENARLKFKIGPAEPVLFGPDQILVTLDPVSAQPIFSVYTINYNKLKVKIYAVKPSDWPEFNLYMREYQRTDEHPSPPGHLVLDETLPVEAKADSLTEVGIDLGRVMDGDFGHFIVIVEPPRSLLPFNQDQYWRVVQAWVQVTQIGLDAFADHSELVAWTTALQDGAPLSGVIVESGSTGVQSLTDEAGLARFDLSSAGTSYLVARQGSDTVVLPKSLYFWGEDAWQSRPISDELRWYVFDDRQMYRPGEEVHVKGWIRRVGGAQDGDVGLVGDAVTSLQYGVMGPQGNELGRGSSEVNALGGFDFNFTLPENANLGYAYIILNALGNLGGLNGTEQHHDFQIQEFRRPEFEVQARNETEGPYFVGEHAVVAVSASYFAGGPLPNAEVSWRVSSSPSTYRPPNWPDFIFGKWTPWWYYEPRIAYESNEWYYPDYESIEDETYSGVTDASGEHYLRLDFEAEGELKPNSVIAEATVFDVNRQAWSSVTNLLVHPAELYVGLRSERTFVERGTPLDIELIVTDLDGIAVPDRPIQVRAARQEWKYQGGDWGEVEVEVQECKVGSALEPVTCTFETPVGGSYLITALVSDEMGRQNQSQFTRWVSGGQRPPAREVEQETVTLIPDKESYQPGDVAQVLVQAPFTPAEGLLTVSRSGMLYTEPFRIEDGTLTLQVPVEEKHIPNLHIQVDLVGSAPRVDDQGETLTDVPPRPAYASGQLNLSIPPLQRRLTLQATPLDTELEPGGETSIDLVLKDAAGRPVSNAELAVVVVDEAILALSNYQLVDPMAIFYQNRPADLSARYGRSSIVLIDPRALSEEYRSEMQAVQATGVVEKEGEALFDAAMAEPAAAPEEGALINVAGAGSEPVSIRVRSDFNPLAAFEPVVRTNADGGARVSIKLPDNLTRYRVMVVAVDDSGKQFGSAEANMTARLPLMVRPSAPRFLNFGDYFELSVVLQNQTDEPMVVEVVVQGGNIELTGSPGQRVTVPARDRIELRFPATTVLPGTARFQIAAVSGNYADAAAVELPVYTPATTEAFATYGVVDEGAVIQPVAAPSEVFPQFGGLEISTSSTALQALTDAVMYLVSYPYECSEQLASRILGVAALRDVLTAFSAEGLPSPQEMEAAVQRDIKELEKLQNYDGGFPYWRRGSDSIPYNTIHVAHALQKAKLKGFEVPEEMQWGVLGYLSEIESYYPHWYGKRIRQTLSAYAVYVRALMGDRDVGKARGLLAEDELDELPLEALAWLWQVIQDDPNSVEEVEAIRRHINNRAVETAGAANFTTSYGDQAYLLLHSNRRTDALLLDALIADQPQNDLIPKVVTGLLAHRKAGRWYNTQENVFVLLALDRYFNTFEAQEPDFVARIWLGDTYAGSHEFAGRTTERHEINIPMAYLVDESLGGGETQDLIVSKDGPGRLYYRLGLRYAPDDLELEPLDMGFVVQRVYEAVDDPEDVYRDKDGVWHIKAGARVRVRLTMVADNRRYHVALVDPLAAGLEIVNPSLAVSGSIPQDPDSPDYHYGWWWRWTWYEHQNMRDERAEAFTSLLWDGVYSYTYVARATTPGTFVVPPAKAEEMYSPEVFGRSGSDLVVVEDR